MRLGKGANDWQLGLAWWLCVMTYAACQIVHADDEIKLKVSRKVVVVGTLVGVQVTTARSDDKGSVKLSIDCGYNGFQSGSAWETDTLTDTQYRSFYPDGKCWVRATLTRGGKTIQREEKVEVVG